MENAIIQRYKPTFDDGLTKDQRYYRRHRKNRKYKYNSVYANRYYQKHKDYWKDFAKNRDKEKHLEICAKWRKNNKEKIKLWREKNKDYSKLWCSKNCDKIKVYGHNRRTKTKDLNKKIIQLVYEDNIKRYGTLTCYLCLNPIEFGKDHLEHKIPLSRGGTNEYQNLSIACQGCNCSKHNKTEFEYRTLKNK